MRHMGRVGREVIFSFERERPGFGALEISEHQVPNPGRYARGTQASFYLFRDESVSLNPTGALAEAEASSAIDLPFQCTKAWVVCFSTVRKGRIRVTPA